MIENVALQFGLTVLFAAAAYYLIPALTANPLSDRVDAALHAVAGLAMVAMLWPWGMAIPPMAGVVVFTGAAAWFAVKAAAERENPYRHWYHGAMMASMIVMWIFMAHLSPTTASHSDAAMTPMAMGGADMPYHHAPHRPRRRGWRTRRWPWAWPTCWRQPASRWSVGEPAVRGNPRPTR